MQTAEQQRHAAEQEAILRAAAVERDGQGGSVEVVMEDGEAADGAANPESETAESSA
jgi:hypothetical protein